MVADLPQPRLDQVHSLVVNRDFITIVSGLPRSGTSLMMQMLAAGGIPPVTDHVRQADEDNPRGYFEFDAVKRLRTDQSWLDLARGHAVKVIHLLLRELPTSGSFCYRVIFMRRPLEEVLASQRAMLERAGKQAADEALLAKVYRRQLEQAEQWLAAQPAFAVLFLEHSALFQNPQPTVAEVNDFLGGGMDLAAMRGTIDPALYRQRKNANKV